MRQHADEARSPTALRIDQHATALEIDWGNGVSHALSFRLLRERCRCAECTQARRRAQPVNISNDIAVMEATPYGSNAVQLVFSDGHSRGIFPFSYLLQLGRELQQTTATP